MKNLFNTFPHRSLRFTLVVYAVVTALIILWISRMLNTVNQDNLIQSRTFLALSFLFPAALLSLSVVNLVRVFSARRSGLPGSRIRLRLVGSFVLTILIAIVPFGILSALFLRTAISHWLAPQNGLALEAGRELAWEHHRENLTYLAHMVESDFIQDLLSNRDLKIDEIWGTLQSINPRLEAFQVFREEHVMRMGRPELFSQRTELLAESGALPRRIVNGRSVISWQSVENDQIIVFSSLLSEEFGTNLQSIIMAQDDWRFYERLGGRIIRSLVLFGIFLSGPLFMMAFLTAVTLSDRVIRPLVALGEATAKISAGDFSFRILPPRKDELAFLTQSFNAMIQELKVSRMKIVQTEKVAAWQVIAQRLAHEIRNPLTPIKLSAQRVQMKTLEGELNAEMINQSMALILREVEGLDKLLQDFREIAGGRPVDLIPTKIKALLKETVDAFQTLNSALEWAFIDGGNNPSVMIDSMQIRQVLVNLLNNAVEAEATKILVRVDVVYRGTAPNARVMIQDNGEGIAPDRVGAVFQPYNSTRNRGTGLGLAVVQRIVYDHQGRIWFESELGSGTVFYIDFPMEVDA